MLCVRCKKRPAVVFVQRMDGGEQKSEGYCLTCAKELGIKPVDDLMKQFGISGDDLENMENQMMNFMQNGMEGMETDGEPVESEDDTDAEGDFTPGGNATFPFNIFGNLGKMGAQDAEFTPLEEKSETTAKKTRKPKKRAKNASFWIPIAKT